MIVGKADYLDQMENLLKVTRKFEKTNPKNYGTLNFAVNQKKHVENIFKRTCCV